MFGRNLRSIFHNRCCKIFLFIILLAANIIVFCKTYKTYHDQAEYFYLYQMLGDSLCWARASAAAICLNIFAVMISMCKIFCSYLRNLFFKISIDGPRRLLDEKKSIHILCGLLVCLFSIIHTLAHCVNNLKFCKNYDVERKGLNLFPEEEKVDKFFVFFTTTGMTGILMLIILVLMFTSSISSVRRQNYVIFWYTHHLAFPFIILLLLHNYGCVIKRQMNLTDHVPGCLYLNETLNSTTQDAVLANGVEICKAPPQFEHDPAQAWKWILFPLLLYVIDRLIRKWRGSKNVEIIKVVPYEGNVIELQLSQKGFSALPGQYIQLQCPQIAKFEWHPFTLTKCPAVAGDYFSVHIKILGKWTDRVRSQLVVNTEITSSAMESLVEYSKRDGGYVTNLTRDHEHLRLFVDGPYGSPCQDVTKYSVSICIAAGIGVTPFAAIINSLRLKVERCKLKRLYFIWVSRDIYDFHWFLQLLHDFYLEMSRANKLDFFICNFYLTGNKADCEKGTGVIGQNLSIGWLKSRLHFGRPRWDDDVFDVIAKNHKRDLAYEKRQLIASTTLRDASRAKVKGVAANSFSLYRALRWHNRPLPSLHSRPEYKKQ